MLLEIVNPSDAYTFEAPDLEMAAMVVYLLGRGAYAAVDEDGEMVVPLFLFGGHDKWFQKNLGASLAEVADRVYEERRGALIDCLESVVIGDREEYEKLLREAEDPRTFRTEWLNNHRSSLNNIGGLAQEIADNLRNQSQEGEEA